MATDLNLHRKTAVTSHDTQEGRARDKEVHNRERTWLLCFALDRSTSAQVGKPHSIREECAFLFKCVIDLTKMILIFVALLYVMSSNGSLPR
jgi:hypothetical protein